MKEKETLTKPSEEQSSPIDGPDPPDPDPHQNGQSSYSSSSPTADHHPDDNHHYSGQEEDKDSPMQEQNDQDYFPLPSDNQDPEALDAERKHYLRIIKTYKKYSIHNLAKIKSTLSYLKQLPKHHQILLKDYKKHLIEVKKCVEENQNLALLIVMDEAKVFANQNEFYPEKEMKQISPEPSVFDFDKMEAVFKHITRDWSDEGKDEREVCYGPIIEQVEKEYGGTKNAKGFSPIRILVPGAGMGRLAYELVCKGYIVEGNEFSLFMIFASNFVLNKCTEENQFKCYPWIHQTTNVLNHADQIRPVPFPSPSPTQSIPPGSRFSMTAGDFLEVYGNPDERESWDCITTCFFIDCANNILSYIEHIYFCLKPGGLWVNLGPLLYHYADMPSENSIEPSWDLLRGIIGKMGFVIEKEETDRPTFYADNAKSMLKYTYKSIFLVCRKGSGFTKESMCSSSTSLSDTKSNNEDTSS